MRLIDIRTVKKKVSAAYPLDSALRALIMRETDFLPEDEFYNKVTVWLSLAEIEAEKTASESQSPAASYVDYPLAEGRHNASYRTKK